MSTGNIQNTEQLHSSFKDYVKNNVH